MDEIQRQKIIAKIQKLRLMADFCNPNPKTMNYKVLQERCEYLKVDEKGVSGMCAFSEELLAEGCAEGRMAGRMEGRVEGRAEGRVEGILVGYINSTRNMVKRMKVEAEEAMDVLNVPLADRPKILAAL